MDYKYAVFQETNKFLSQQPEAKYHVKNSGENQTSEIQSQTANEVFYKLFSTFCMFSFCNKIFFFFAHIKKRFMFKTKLLPNFFQECDNKS